MTVYAKQTPTVIVTEKANITVILSIFFGGFLSLAVLSLVYPFFINIFMFSTIIFTLFICFACVSAYDDKEKGVKRVKPKQKVFFPKGTLHVFFIIMIAISAGLKLGYFSIAACWLLSWIASCSLRTHVRATYIKETDNENG